MASALLNPLVIDNYLQLEIQTGRVAGPFSKPPLPVLHVSRFRVNPKRHLPGKWHLILDLSSHAVHSVNDGIVGEDYSVQYMKVHNAAGAGFPSGEIWCAKCILYCASPYRRSPVAGYEMVWCLLCRYGPAFQHHVSSIHLHRYSRLCGVGGQAKLRRHLPDVFPWWLSHSLPSQLLCLSTQSGQVYWIFF